MSYSKKGAYSESLPSVQATTEVVEPVVAVGVPTEEPHAAASPGAVYFCADCGVRISSAGFCKACGGTASAC